MLSGSEYYLHNDMCVYVYRCTFMCVGRRGRGPGRGGGVTRLGGQGGRRGPALGARRAAVKHRKN